MPTTTENKDGGTVVDIKEAKAKKLAVTENKGANVDIDKPTEWAKLFADKEIKRAKRLRDRRVGEAERSAEKQRLRAESKEQKRMERAAKTEALRAEKERIRIESVAKRAALKAETLAKMEEARASNGFVRDGIMQRKAAPPQGTIPRPNMPHPDVRDVQETFRTTYEEHCGLVADALKNKTVDGASYRSMSSYFRVKLGLPA